MDDGIGIVALVILFSLAFFPEEVGRIVADLVNAYYAVRQ